MRGRGRERWEGGEGEEEYRSSRWVLRVAWSYLFSTSLDWSRLLTWQWTTRPKPHTVSTCFSTELLVNIIYHFEGPKTHTVCHTFSLVAIVNVFHCFKALCKHKEQFKITCYLLASVVVLCIMVFVSATERRRKGSQGGDWQHVSSGGRKTIPPPEHSGWFESGDAHVGVSLLMNLPSMTCGGFIQQPDVSKAPHPSPSRAKLTIFIVDTQLHIWGSDLLEPAAILLWLRVCRRHLESTQWEEWDERSREEERRGFIWIHLQVFKRGGCWQFYWNCPSFIVMLKGESLSTLNFDGK